MLKQKLINIETSNSINFHLFFLFLLSLNYLFPLIIFGNITLFYLDALDSEIPYNYIIGKILKGDFESVKIFLNGQIDILFLRRIFHPYSFVYSLFTLEVAYWILDILVKITSYFSFFLLSKKINKNLFICGLISCLYASSNLPTHEGFGLAIFPYLIYLILFKNKLELKHYLTVFFFGLNSDFIFTAFAMPSLAILLLLLQKKEKLFNFFKVLILFSIALVISNINLIIITFQNIEFHRSEWVSPANSISESFVFFIKEFVPIPVGWNWSFFSLLPYSLYKIPIFFIALFSNDKNVKRILIILIGTVILQTFIYSEFIGNFINQQSGLLKELSWSYLSQSYYVLYCLLAIYIFNNLNYIKKILLYFIITSVLLFQINSSIVPFGKEKIFKINNYQNLYTFKGYYFFNDYKKVKEIVGENKVMSVGLDPMVAIIHNINVIDGYHSIYPLKYKKQFKSIIEQELEADPTYKKYFNEWGSRVYTSLYGTEEPKLNYKYAKNIGARFVISKPSLNSEYLSLVYGDCDKEKFCLYKIK